MEHPLYQIIEQYGIYAVFFLCMIEGDVTLLIAGVMAHGGFFGPYSFFKVIVFGTLGGIAGDCIGYWTGRSFHEKTKDRKFYRVAQPRIEKIIDKFGASAIIISKYIYGVRAAMCVFYGVAKMPFPKFLALSALSCFLWVILFSGLGYFFSGAITSIIGDFRQIGIAVFFIFVAGVVGFYLLERYWLSDRVEKADPETIHKIEETLLTVEEVGLGTLHDLGERLHLTREPSKEDVDPEKNGDADKPVGEKTAKGQAASQDRRL